MPTQLRDFSCRQDALTVFMDYHNKEEKNELHEIVKDFFNKQMQIIYLCGDDCSKSGADLYQFIRQKVQRYDATLPASNRFVFCHYLRLNDLTEEWITSWQERVQEFQNRLTVTDAFKQYHVVCLSYESSEHPLGNAKEEIAVLVKKLTTELLDIAHVTYLLYTNGFETLTRQDQGIVQFLYLVSRDGTSSTLLPMQNRTRLKMLNYSDYSEKMAEDCTRKIAELERWMTEEVDPGLLDFMDTVRTPLQNDSRELVDAEMDFDSRVDIYPVHVDDFVKTGFLPNSPRTSSIGADHEIIQKRKKEYFGNLLDKMVSGFDVRSLEEKVQKKLYYKDLQSLNEIMQIPAWEEGSLEDRMRASVLSREEGRAKKSIEQLIDAICDKVRRKLREPLASTEKMRQEKQTEMQRTQKKLDVAGRFSDIHACFHSIASETAFKPISGLSPEFQKTMCLIGSECYGKWYSENYTIADVAYAHYCVDNDPTDITLFKTGDLLELNSDDAVQNLMRIL